MVTEGSSTSTLAQKLTYDYSSTPVVTDVTPNVLSVEGIHIS